MATAPRLPVLRARRPWAEIRSALETFQARFPSAQRLAADPVQLAHEYRDPADREVVALVAACLAFGRVGSLVAKARAALGPLGPRPARAVQALRPGRVPPHLERWKHRWVDGRQLTVLLAGLGRTLRQGTLGEAFRAGLEDDAPHLLEAMAAFARTVAHPDPAAWLGDGPRHGLDFLLPRPDGRAAAKRLCLYLRWMVRPADGVDLGLWHEVRPSRLTVPLDTHVGRIAAYLGLTGRSTPGWPMAREITDNLARFDTADPTRYDFALAHLGIMGGCPRRRDPRRCQACDLVPACRM